MYCDYVSLIGRKNCFSQLPGRIYPGGKSNKHREKEKAKRYHVAIEEARCEIASRERTSLMVKCKLIEMG